VARSGKKPGLKVCPADPGVNIELASTPGEHSSWLVIASNS
jgi:hypothetical protein